MYTTIWSRNTEKTTSYPLANQNIWLRRTSDVNSPETISELLRMNSLQRDEAGYLVAGPMCEAMFGFDENTN
jgi:hypothetical protein